MPHRLKEVARPSPGGSDHQRAVSPSGLGGHRPARPRRSGSRASTNAENEARGSIRGIEGLLPGTRAARAVTQNIVVTCAVAADPYALGIIAHLLVLENVVVIPAGLLLCTMVVSPQAGSGQEVPSGVLRLRPAQLVRPHLLGRQDVPGSLRATDLGPREELFEVLEVHLGVEGDDPQDGKRRTTGTPKPSPRGTTARPCQ